MKQQAQPQQNPKPKPKPKPEPAKPDEKEQRIAKLEEQIEKLKRPRRAEVIRDDMGRVSGMREVE